MGGDDYVGLAKHPRQCHRRRPGSPQWPVGSDVTLGECLARSVRRLFFWLGGGVTVSARGHQGTLEAKDDVAIRPAKSLK